MAKEEDILNPCGHTNSERIEALKNLPRSVWPACPACLYERIKELETKLKIFTRPANYEVSGIKPPCCDVLVEIANQALKGSRSDTTKRQILKEHRIEYSD